MAGNQTMNHKRRRTRSGSTSGHPAPNYATITDLPNEILVIVLEQLDDPDLYNLALLCRRLNLQALSLYFSRCGFRVHRGQLLVPNGQYLYARDQPRRPLTAAIFLALFIHTLNYLACSVDTDDEQQTRILERLIRHLPAVSEVLIVVYGDFTDWPSPHPLARLISALENKSCKSLTIHDGYAPGRIPVGIELGPIRTLESITFSNNFLLLSPWLGWTTQTINASPIASLDLASDPAILAKVLPQLTLPHLTWFSVQPYRCFETLSLSILASFLARHHRLETLIVLTSLRPDFRLPRKLLPTLAILHGDTFTLTHLLAEPMAWPQLKTVRVTDLMAQTPTRVYDFFRNISRTNTSCLAISMVTFQNNDWFVSRSSRLRRGRSRVETTLTQITSVYLTDVVVIRLDTLVGLAQWLAMFLSLKELTFDSYLDLRPCQEVAVVDVLGVACPGVETFALNGRSGTFENWRSGTQLRAVPRPDW